MEDEKLIQEVRKYSCLWNTSSASYRDIKAKDTAWKQVAVEMGQAGCVGKYMKRWKNLRDRFVRELKKTKLSRNENGESLYTSTWGTFDKLLFLQEIVRHRLTQSVISSPLCCELPENESQANGGSDDDSVNTGELSTSSEAGFGNNLESTSLVSLQPRKRRKKSFMDEPLLMSRQIDCEDEDELYGRQLAATLRRLPGQQKAFAKVEIQKVLLEIEYPKEQKTSN